MKKLFFAAMASLLLIACSDKKKDDDSSVKKSEMEAFYEKNLTVLKNGIANFENENLEGWGAIIADSVVWQSPAYGDSVTTKAHWMESLKYYIDNWSNLKLTNARFHPGVDRNTHEPDGSVRYYGDWSGVHSSGKVTIAHFYGTYDFNKENKIISGSEYFDLGGMINALKPQ